MIRDGTNWKRLRQSYKDFCVQFEPTEMITLAINQDASLSKATKLLERFSGRMDSWGIGTTWSQTHFTQRANGIFFVEHVRSNIHLHGLVRFPYANRCGRAWVAAEIWKKLCPSGTFEVKPAYYPVGAADYMTKEMKWHDFDGGQIILLADLMSEKSRTPKPTKQR